MIQLPSKLDHSALQPQIRFGFGKLGWQAGLHSNWKVSVLISTLCVRLGNFPPSPFTEFVKISIHYLHQLKICYKLKHQEQLRGFCVIKS